MRHTLSLATGLAALATALACTAHRPDPVVRTDGDPMTTRAAQPAEALPEPSPSVAPPANPLLREWTGPYGGVPAFDAMRLADLEAAFDAAMAEHRREIEAIAADPQPPTFENTIVALERAGRTLDRVDTYYGIWRSNLSSPEFRDVQERVEPKRSELRTEIVQNEALFRRVAAVHRAVEAKGGAGLAPDQRRLVELVYDGFARNGATLEGPAKQRYAEIQQQLSDLYTRFANNVLADEDVEKVVNVR